MARVTATEVKQIMDNCTVTDTIVEVMIDAASEVITQIYSGNSDISDTLLKEIERWFTAHMLASTLSRTTSEEKLGDASVKFTGKWGEKLSSTSYGQMVLTLDWTGLMSKAGKQAAGIYAVETKEYDI